MYFRAVFVERKLALHVEVDSLVGALSPTSSCGNCANSQISSKGGDISEDRIFFQRANLYHPWVQLNTFFSSYFEKFDRNGGHAGRRYSTERYQLWICLLKGEYNIVLTNTRTLGLDQTTSMKTTESGEVWI